MQWVQKKKITNIKNVDPDIMAQTWLQELILQSILQNIDRGQSIQQALGNVGLQLLPEIQKLEIQHHSIVALRSKEHVGADSRGHRRKRATVANRQVPELHRHFVLYITVLGTEKITSLQREVVEHIVNHGPARISDD